MPHCQGSRGTSEAAWEEACLILSNKGTSLRSQRLFILVRLRFKILYIKQVFESMTLHSWAGLSPAAETSQPDGKENTAAHPAECVNHGLRQWMKQNLRAAVNRNHVVKCSAKSGCYKEHEWPDTGRVGRGKTQNWEENRADRFSWHTMKMATRLHQVHNHDTENRKWRNWFENQLT